ncbi:methyl-accepting chemotaxis protein [Kosakonia oryzendophytica]|uniref:methyl-accepting chemotaxis protein n=1 Tax=Kosakonia oryzendophytica TaxID=1005665 RepID=UPI000776CB02|nr:methyl-accepting chemotaxis protein [Kosakonia oryzendophytica]WBT56321.1 methyl-accepting chemotaxis protein [Kosakonia oryzendophytica]
MTILKKLVLLFIFTLAVIIMLGGLSLYALKEGQSRFEYVTSNSLGSINILSEVLQHREEARRQILMSLLVNQRDVFDMHMKVAMGELEKAHNLLTTYENTMISDENDANLIRKTLQAFDSYHLKVNDLAKAYQVEGVEAARQMVSDKGPTALASVTLSECIKQMLDYNYKIANNYSQISHTQYIKTLWIFIITISVAVIIVGFFTYAVLNYLKKGLHTLQDSMKNIGETLDLTLRVNFEKNDELGATAKSFNGLITKINAVLTSVKEATKEVDSASNEIATSNDDLSSRTEAQASSLEQTAASMNELSVTVKHNMDNAKEANNYIQHVQSIVNESNNDLSLLKASIDDISASSNKISEITSIIDGIAFQTNILALNAAVEAARAGEQGKGFAVVAGEVRSLSQRSSVAARDIRNLIDEAIKNVSKGVDYAGNVTIKMNEALGIVDNTTQLINQVNHSSTEQSYGIEQVNIAVSQMEGNLQQNAAMVEEMAAAANSLSQQASKLSSEISAFQL